MTKHPAQNAHTPPGRDGRPETGDESHPRNSGPKQTLSSATGKWLIIKGLAFWHVFPPDADRVVFYTWQQAMAYVNRQIRAEQLTKAAHEVANAGIPARFFTHVEAGQ